MSGGSSAHRLIAAALVVAMVLAVSNETTTRAADDSASNSSTGKSAGKTSATSKDLFVVPDGKSPALLAFIAKMRRIKPPKNASDEEKKEFLTKSHKAMLEAATAILETKPTGSPRVAALKANIEALVALDELGDDQARKQLGDLADELKDDKQVEVAKLVKPFVGFAA